MMLFKTVNIILWKSHITVAKMEVFWKLWTLFIRNRSMHLGFPGLLKQVFSITKFFESYFNRNSDKLDSVCSALKSPDRRNLS